MSKGDPVVSSCSFSPSKLAAIPVRVITRAFPRLNAASWDLQYKFGLWDHLDLTQSTGLELFQMVEEYAPMASILDLGCGTTANLPLTPGRFRHYHGVDISEKAIERARQLGRAAATYETADILTYVPRKAYDVILLREVIYYLPLAKVAQLLRGLSAFLTPNGVILIQIWAGDKNSGLLGAMKASDLPVMLEKTLGPGPGHPTVYLMGKPENRARVLDSRAS
jgi:2-polyprenyl-3-methyl-5-hydroxy-6-metoxy-1,4-benzoquinol methylase